jgi:hypothetical protein
LASAIIKRFGGNWFKLAAGAESARGGCAVPTIPEAKAR